MTKKNIYYHLVSPFLIISLICFFMAAMSLVYRENQKALIPRKINSSQGPVIKKQVADIRLATIQQKSIIKNDQEIISVSPTSTTFPTSQLQKQATPTNTPTPSTISVQINEPDGSSTFFLPIENGSTPCSLLFRAKDIGKVRSVTTLHYGAPLDSDYVKELNGYSDNWTFQINGETKPLGCSHYSLSQNNSLIWKYN